MTQQTILTVIYLIWLFLVLVLLWRIWRDGAMRTHQLQQTLIDACMKAADASTAAADAARTLAHKEKSNENVHEPI